MDVYTALINSWFRDTILSQIIMLDASTQAKIKKKFETSHRLLTQFKNLPILDQESVEAEMWDFFSNTKIDRFTQSEDNFLKDLEQIFKTREEAEILDQIH